MREVLSPLAARLVLLRPKGLSSCFGRPRACSELALIGISKGGRGVECVGGSVHCFLDHATVGCGIDNTTSAISSAFSTVRPSSAHSSTSPQSSA